MTKSSRKNVRQMQGWFPVTLASQATLATMSSLEAEDRKPTFGKMLKLPCEKVTVMLTIHTYQNKALPYKQTHIKIDIYSDLPVQ